MYNEKSFKRTIVFIQIRRYIFIFLFVILSLVGAYFVGEFLTEIIRLDRNIANYIMIATGVTVFITGFLLTSNLSFKVKEAYLEMEINRKLLKIYEALDIVDEDLDETPLKINKKKKTKPLLTSGTKNEKTTTIKKTTTKREKTKV